MAVNSGRDTKHLSDYGAEYRVLIRGGTEGAPSRYHKLRLPVLTVLLVMVLCDGTV